MSVWKKPRAELLQLPGVGRKIADCVLLFAYGFQSRLPGGRLGNESLARTLFSATPPSILRLQRFTGNILDPMPVMPNNTFSTTCARDAH